MNSKALFRIMLAATAIGLIAGCGTQATSPGGASSAASSTETPQSQRPMVDTAESPAMAVFFDWAIDVSDPTVVFEASSTVVSGSVSEVQSSWVDDQGFINTTYVIDVAKTYKGDIAPGQQIKVSLLGGTMSLGDFIAEVDRAGIYDEVFTEKSTDFWLGKGYESAPPDPRSEDPATLVTHNFGSDPASESLNETIQPDAWVFFLNEDPDGTFSGTVLNHSLMYLSGGKIHSLFPEEAGDRDTSVAESELGS